MTRLPNLAELRGDGSAAFEGGRVVCGLDVVVFCTGYQQRFPFMDHLGLLQTGAKHVCMLRQACTRVACCRCTRSHANWLWRAAVTRGAR